MNAQGVRKRSIVIHIKRHETNRKARGGNRSHFKTRLVAEVARPITVPTFSPEGYEASSRQVAMAG
jgi:hypothetical protein